MDPGSRARVRAAGRAFRALPKDLRNDLRRQQRGDVGAVWKSEMSTSAAAARRVEQRQVFQVGNRVSAGLPIKLVAGASNRTLSGGGVISDLARPEEFGSGRRANYTRYNRRSPKGTTHTVTRRASRQLPPAKRSGWVVYRAVAETVPQVIGMWVVEAGERIKEAWEGR